MNYPKELVQICSTIIEETFEKSKYAHITKHRLVKSNEELIYNSTNNFPKSITLTQRIKAIANNDPCKCEECGKIHGDIAKEKYCSHKCYLKNKTDNSFGEEERKLRAKKKQEEEIQAKYENAIEGEDYVVCKICGYKGADLGTHIKTHGMNSKKYKEIYGKVAPIKCDKMCRRLKGKNNPAHNHGGKFSPFSKKFIHYTNDEDIRKLHEKAEQSRIKNNSHYLKVVYWLEEANGDWEEAKRLRNENRTLFSLDYCIEKYGEEKGRERWLKRQEKWQKNYKKSNFSKISQELFWSIAKNLDDLTDIYFAELDKNKQKDKSGRNHEHRLVLDRLLLPDFIDLKQRKIIEFDGEYWHSVNNKDYNFENRTNRDDIREQVLIDNNYSVLRVSETDFREYPDEILDICLEFLKE